MPDVAERALTSLLRAVGDNPGATVGELALYLRWEWTDVYCRLGILAHEGLISWTGAGSDAPVAVNG